MTNRPSPVALEAAAVAPRTRTIYPAALAACVAGREKRPLGDAFGLANFGINLTRLKPGSASALRHHHSRQDEFIYVLAGEPVLVSDAGETPLKPGMCAGFKAGAGDGHHLVNRGAGDVVYLEIGDRSAGDAVVYPDDDLALEMGPDGKLQVRHKNGQPY
ncbi:MAG TPA: cupin domain-containing protein [Stellaceae bacterium]|nr:cupin domain-containing protein [Stellaceae bacterium]